MNTIYCFLQGYWPQYGIHSSQKSDTVDKWISLVSKAIVMLFSSAAYVLQTYFAYRSLRILYGKATLSKPNQMLSGLPAVQQ